MRTIRNLGLTIIGSVMNVSYAVADAVVERATGSVAAAACASCHGVEGEGNAQIGLPMLAGLPREYFVKQIADFQAGRRISPIGTPEDRQLSNAEVLHAEDAEAVADYYARWMIGVAKGISLEDAKAAAGYYARLPRPKPQANAGNPAITDPEVLAHGKKLAINGDWDRNIAPCFKCHAAGGVGVAPGFPPLAGQHASYVVRQLKAWRAGVRNNDPLDLMKTLSENLTDDDIHAVAAYLATLGTQEKHASNSGDAK